VVPDSSPDQPVRRDPPSPGRVRGFVTFDLFPASFAAEKPSSFLTAFERPSMQAPSPSIAGKGVISLPEGHTFTVSWQHAGRKTMVYLDDNLPLTSHFRYGRSWSAPNSQSEIRNDDLLELILERASRESSYDPCQRCLTEMISAASVEGGSFIPDLVGEAAKLPDGHKLLTGSDPSTIFLRDGRCLVIKEETDKQGLQLTLIDQFGEKRAHAGFTRSETAPLTATRLTQLRQHAVSNLQGDLIKDAARHPFSDARDHICKMGFSLQRSEFIPDVHAGIARAVLLRNAETQRWELLLEGVRDLAGIRGVILVKGVSRESLNMIGSFAEELQTLPFAAESFLRLLDRESLLPKAEILFQKRAASESVTAAAHPLLSGLSSLPGVRGLLNRINRARAIRHLG